MHAAIKKLLSIVGQPIGSHVDMPAACERLAEWGTIGSELAEMLHWRNGFYGFDSALLVRPLQYNGSPIGLLEWNSPSVWKRKYVEKLGDVLFFSEDIFGGQFCIFDHRVCTFDPENGQFEVMGSSLGAWADELLADWEFRTGHPVAHAWQIRNGVLPVGKRLIPKVPFVCGGKYEVDNLYALDDVEGMVFRSSIANQIRDLPDGSQIVLEVLRPES